MTTACKHLLFTIFDKNKTKSVCCRTQTVEEVVNYQDICKQKGKCEYYEVMIFSKNTVFDFPSNEENDSSFLEKTFEITPHIQEEIKEIRRMLRDTVIELRNEGKLNKKVIDNICLIRQLLYSFSLGQDIVELFNDEIKNKIRTEQ